MHSPADSRVNRNLQKLRQNLASDGLALYAELQSAKSKDESLQCPYLETKMEKL